jgi:mRNA interferase RelE/StbE
VAAPAYRRHYQKILKEVYPRLRANPYSGPNMRRLTGNLKCIFRYRIGDYRLFYTIDPAEQRVYILELHDRKDAYKKR